jgi:thioredoxin-related protein
MKKYLLAFFTTVLFSFGVADSNERVSWMSFEAAVEALEAQPKKVFIDVYTDWCGWCKKMDANTFSDPRVAKMLAENFYNVKFNAEQRESIDFRDYTFKFVANGRRGYNELAAALLDNRLSYPSVVFLNEKFERIQILPGYRNADEFLKIATFIGEDHYLDTPWEEFSKKFDEDKSSNGD